MGTRNTCSTFVTCDTVGTHTYTLDVCDVARLCNTATLTVTVKISSADQQVCYDGSIKCVHVYVQAIVVTVDKPASNLTTSNVNEIVNKIASLAASGHAYAIMHSVRAESDAPK